eukprot:4793826-Alexandrium_andersonii.AAC.1
MSWRLPPLHRRSPWRRRSGLPHCIATGSAGGPGGHSHPAPRRGNSTGGCIVTIARSATLSSLPW